MPSIIKLLGESQELTGTATNYGSYTLYRVENKSIDGGNGRFAVLSVYPSDGAGGFGAVDRSIYMTPNERIYLKVNSTDGISIMGIGSITPIAYTD